MTAISPDNNHAGAVCQQAAGSHSKATASGLLASHTLLSDMNPKAIYGELHNKFDDRASSVSAAAGCQVTSHMPASDTTAVEASNSSRTAKLAQASNSDATAGALFKAQALPPNSTAAAPSNGGVRKRLAHDCNVSTAANGVRTSHRVPSTSMAAKATEKLVRSRLANDNNSNAAAGGLPIAPTLSQDSMAANATNGNAMSQSAAKLSQTDSTIRSKLGKKRKIEVRAVSC